MCGIKYPGHFIRVTLGIKIRPPNVVRFLHNFNSMNVNGISNNQLHLYIESAGNDQLGCSVYFHGQWPYLVGPKAGNNQILC